MVTVQPRSKSIKAVLTEQAVDPATLVEFVAQVSHLNANRVRLTVLKSEKHVTVDPTQSFEAQGLDPKDLTVYAKDLGPQLSWRGVYITEYLGPLFIHPLLYRVAGSVHTPTQQLALAMVWAHFAKREFESAFVHRFLSATMPAFNVVKNCAYYWGLSGLLLGLFIYSDKPGVLFHTFNHPPAVRYALLAVWLYAQASNGYIHYRLRMLRADGSKEHKVTRGYGFDLVLTPNYFFESLGWAVFTVLVGNWLALLFWAVGSAQMYVWAVKKHKRNAKIPGYPKGRKAMFPWVA